MMGRVSDAERLRKEGFGTTLEPRCVGIYALLCKGLLVYVGKSRNIYQRLGQHFKTRRRGRGMNGSTKLGLAWADVVNFEFDEILIKYCYLDELDRIELDVIERYRPEFNVRIQSVAPFNIRLELHELPGLMELARKKREYQLQRRRL